MGHPVPLRERFPSRDRLRHRRDGAGGGDLPVAAASASIPGIPGLRWAEPDRAQGLGGGIRVQRANSLEGPLSGPRSGAAGRGALLFPTPVVVDADVLIRNVDYAVRKGYKPALLGRASSRVQHLDRDRPVRHAMCHGGGDPPLAGYSRSPGRRGRRAPGVEHVIVPNVRVVPVPPEAMMDQRVAAVATLHAADAPTAALALLLAPSVLVTDNRRDFRPLGLPDTKTDAVAVDVYTLGEMGISVNGVELAARAVGYAGVSGAKKLASTIGREAALASRPRGGWASGGLLEKRARTVDTRARRHNSKRGRAPFDGRTGEDDGRW